MPQPPLRPGQILTGVLFNEPMRVETIRDTGPDTWIVGLVGTSTERFRSVTLSLHDLLALTIVDTTATYDGDGALLRLGLQAYALGIAYEFDPYFGLSISRVDPLPHQLEAVYDYLLKLPRVRFLLADDAGAGKTIMAGLLVRELKLRGLAERILVVCPANLAFQWQRELKEKFDESFLVLKGADIRDHFGINQWLEHRHIITSLDLAKRTPILPGLRQVHWDLVIVDEAHRMSWSPPARKTARYALGEMLRDTTAHLLLLTATPHKGDPTNFSLFLQLLDADAYADVTSIRAAMQHRQAPFYLRRAKESMVYFPELQPDGSWVAQKIFTKRIPHTVDFQIDGPEDRLYRDVTHFVKYQSAKAAAQGDDPRARAVGFLMALYQRRLASSTYALRRSLENRARRLTDGLKRAQAIVQSAPPDLPDPEDLEEMEEQERERLEEMLTAATLAGNADQVREEIGELQRLAEQAQAVEAAGEGINLQSCHILFNYDIPWNPNRLEQRMGRIHRYGQQRDCLIFNFVATNTIEGRVLQRLLVKLQEIRNALDDDAVFSIVSELLPAAHVERVLRDYYAGRLGDADMEERLLRNVDADHFRAICPNALEGLATKTLNLEMLIERRARAQEHRLVPETIDRFLQEATPYVSMTLKPSPSFKHTFEPSRTPTILRRYESQPDWTCAPLAARYPRLSTDREVADQHQLEWVTPGHPLFEALRRHTLTLAQEAFGKGTCFYSLQHDTPSRLDFYRARVVDGLGQVIHERLFAVETTRQRRNTFAGTECAWELRAGAGARASANGGDGALSPPSGSPNMRSARSWRRCGQSAWRKWIASSTMWNYR